MSAPTTVQWLRSAVDRVAVGSSRLAAHRVARTAQGLRRTVQRARAWVGEASGFDKALRLVLLAGAVLIVRKVGTRLGGWAYARVESGAWWWLLWLLAVVWLVAAYRAGRDDWEPTQAAADPDEEAQDNAAGAPDEEPPVELEKSQLPTFQQLCASLAKVGTPHAHIAVLAQDLGATPERVRWALDRCDVTVEPVRMRGRGVSTGIKSDALPAPVAPSDGVVGAGQPANNDNNNTDDDEPEEGVRVRRTDHGMTIIYDLADSVRHQKARPK